MSTPLATPTQLGSFMQQTIAAADPTALLMLDIASGMVRDHMTKLGFSVDPVTADVVIFDPVDTKVFLTGLPVSAVTQVETFGDTTWSTVLPASYSVSKRTGVIAALPWTGVSWPAGPESWRVTYTHGFAVLPSAILGVVLGVAARAFATPAGVEMERLGGYQAKYAIEAAGFSGLELKAISAYSNPRVG